MCYHLIKFLEPSQVSQILSPASQSPHQDEGSAITTIKDKLNKPPNAKEFELGESLPGVAFPSL